MPDEKLPHWASGSGIAPGRDFGGGPQFARPIALPTSWEVLRARLSQAPEFRATDSNQAQGARRAPVC